MFSIIYINSTIKVSEHYRKLMHHDDGNRGNWPFDTKHNGILEVSLTSMQRSQRAKNTKSTNNSSDNFSP